jgi:hypothetical protein
MACRASLRVQNLYYRWSKGFLEAGKKRLAGDTARAATSDEVKYLRREACALKEVVAELTLENRLLKKSVIGNGEDEASDTPHPRKPRLSGVSLAAAAVRPRGEPEPCCELPAQKGCIRHACRYGAGCDRPDTGYSDQPATGGVTPMPLHDPGL